MFCVRVFYYSAVVGKRADIQGAAKKWTPKVFRYYLSNHLEFLYEILQVYLLKPSTSNCQVKCDSVEK